MQKRLFTIESNDLEARDTYRIVLRSDSLVTAASGQFVDLALPGYYLRRPISISDCRPDAVVLYYKVVGEGTQVLSRMAPGAALELLLPLGSGFHPEKCAADALLIGGGLGVAPLYLLAKELLAQGKHATAVLGFNKAEEIVLEEDFRALCDEVVLATLDGSAGVKGFVTDALATLEPDWDYFYTCGPLVMMKAVCRALEGPGEASLEERMGCGSGFCYCCTCETVSGPKRVCMDGPVFKKEELTW